MNQAFMETFGISEAFTPIPTHGQLDLQFVRIVFRQHQVDDGKLQDFLERYYRALQKEIEHESVELLPGVVEILNCTERDGALYNAIGAGNVEIGARMKLDRFELNPYFPVGGFCERPAERYEVLQNGVEQAKAYYGVNFHPEQVVVIGDTAYDIDAARKIGAQMVSVATGRVAYDELSDHDPDLLLKDLTEMERFLEFCGRSEV